MKKIVALMLALVVAFSCITVMSQETEGYKKALLTVKERIGNTDEYDNFTGHTNSYNENISYDFEWRGDGGYLSVTITESGIITRYYFNDKNGNITPISERADRELARKNVEEWMKKINPGISGGIRFTNCTADEFGYEFDYTITHNDYMIPDNDGSVRIDAKAEKISMFYLSYTEDAVFEEGEIVASDTAREVYKNEIGFELQYISDWGKDYNRIVFPVYLPKNNNNRYVSALSGEIIEIVPETDEVYKGSNGVTIESAMATDSASGGFTQAEIEELEKIELTVSEQKAVDAIRNCSFFRLPDKAFEYIDISTYDIDDETRGYSIMLKWDAFSVRARVNAENGTILNYSKSRKDSEATITEDAAYETANKAFEYLLPEIYGQYKLYDTNEPMPIPYEEDDKKPQTASFVYARYVNGIPFYDNTVSVNIDLADNSVIGFSQYHSYVDFPGIDNVVSYDEAAKSYFDSVGFEPLYVSDGEKYRLVYCPVSCSYRVDAVTGKVNVPENEYSYSDVSGHYSEKFVNQLLKLNIGFNGGELKPDEPIKQKEFVALLYECVMYKDSVMIDDNYAYEDFYEVGISQIIPDKSKQNPDGNVTRLDAAEFTVCTLGYAEIGDLDIYRPMFKDMEHAGCASILCGLGIMNGDGNGNFNPDGILTRAQALIIVYNYLNI